ncbi:MULTISPECIES: HAMP domain-containing methyl-accepting chemotaxis protein [unclassified Coleofasciculus]|uniref:methyl-accepting chemotaxis protein n=1 Tax=unclassified Coleofasciculus TaxID=2692782 RepID=UPI001880796D|nr:MULTISPECIES: HAMP domain-containing methyl-accepting chemotaxis protein [unclassified Coleofasciculus]MBE9124696.1 HAMP domain-containing protein [Coleofasciculus sp. LEGE 07081]MBE9147023.1 HAMP domain-containing protein [Coleofasciculus sp. LEGE 07092]
MASSTDYVQEYGQAQKAYMQGSYEEAAEIVNRLIEDFPDDPSALLLRGHIYCYGLQQYDVAREQYELVLNLTSEPDFIEYANRGLEDANHLPHQADTADSAASTQEFDESYPDIGKTDDLSDTPTFETWQELDTSDQSDAFDLGALDFDDAMGDDFPQTADQPFADPFGDSDFEQETTEQTVDGLSEDDIYPFALTEEAEGDEPYILEETSTEFDLDADNFENAALDDATGNFFPNVSDEPTAATFMMPSTSEDFELEAVYEEDSEPFDSAFPLDDDLSEPGTGTVGFEEDLEGESYDSGYPVFEDETLLMSSGELEESFPTDTEDFDYSGEEPEVSRESFPEGDYTQEDQSFDRNGFNSQEHFDFDNFDDTFGSDSFAMDEVAEADTASYSGMEGDRSATEGFLDAFDVFDDDLGSIPDFSLEEREEMSHPGASESDFDVLSNSGMVAGSTGAIGLSENGDRPAATQSYPSNTSNDEEVFSITGNSLEQVPVFNQPKETDHEPIVSVEQGWLAPFENASLKQKQWITALAAGVVSMVMVAVVSFVAASTATDEKPSVVNHLRKTGGFMTLAAGIGSFATTLFLTRLTTRQIQRVTADLQSQFDAVAQGNLNVSVPVYSEGELGQLASGFNQMARVILTTTSEAQRKAEEQEQAKEDLQRQVIRLLDDVEGAARGDLTVQAEVTADVLGAVADSFNLTIQNLREIVQQVKDAARKVTKGSTDSESFARALSSDALRQAEELAVTLNSVQVMTDSIQRVAEAAREAEEVAHSASETAQRGGEAVERTVAGILQIRETVAETTRKVKRLAESSQEISKIVAVISTIASRTNLLALNASIEAARAGEAGRGFAVVADEVRQLADRAAKALKEIEQIVMQIQSETGSVMTAMEEGTQQVIDGTKRAEQAKRALEDIIQVSNRIDALVRSIKADTVEQTETSRAVAQVMQSVELTAQETSQEAQRVSSALQNLVGVARDLLTSVERFRVESNDSR